MNDNVAPYTRLEHRPRIATEVQDMELAIVRDVAARAIAKPESLSMGEIQEVGWAFLIASKELAQKSRMR